MKKLAALLFVLALIPAVSVRPAVGQQGYRVIVHKDNPTSELSKTDISNFLLKKKRKWAHGPKALPIDLTGDSSVRETFSEDVHQRSVSRIERYWKTQIFSGKDVPPPEVGDDSAVVSFVASNPGGIGYVSPGAQLGADVKVLAVASDS